MIEITEQEIMKNWEGDMNTPLVSICTITYNHEKYISEALDSFLMQETNFPFELVVDDDCSPDGTAGVIKSYIEKFPNIIKANLREKNVGMMPNFIENMQRAKGKYIALCEGDDYWTDPLKLQRQKNFLDQNKDYILCYHHHILVNNQSQIIDYNNTSSHFNSFVNPEELICAERYIKTCTVFFRNIITSFSKELRNGYHGDVMLWHLLSFYGKNEFLEEIDPAHYRIHDTSVWSSLDPLSSFIDHMKSMYPLMRKLEDDKRLLARLKNRLLLGASRSLYKAIQEKNYTLFINILKYIMQDKNIQKIRFVLYFLPYTLYRAINVKRLFNKNKK